MSISAEDRAFITKHDLNGLFRAMMASVLAEKPDDPLHFLLSKLQTSVGSDSTTPATTPTPVPPTQSGPSSERRRLPKPKPPSSSRGSTAERRGRRGAGAGGSATKKAKPHRVKQALDLFPVEINASGSTGLEEDETPMPSRPITTNTTEAHLQVPTVSSSKQGNEKQNQLKVSSGTSAQLQTSDRRRSTALLSLDEEEDEEAVAIDSVASPTPSCVVESLLCANCQQLLHPKATGNSFLPSSTGTQITPTFDSGASKVRQVPSIRASNPRVKATEDDMLSLLRSARKAQRGQVAQQQHVEPKELDLDADFVEDSVFGGPDNGVDRQLHSTLSKSQSGVKKAVDASTHGALVGTWRQGDADSEPLSDYDPTVEDEDEDEYHMGNAGDSSDSDKAAFGMGSLALGQSGTSELDTWMRTHRQ
eukprot:m.207695 g.207695  ORF g.207695 m.207695 type:complete len:420 (+) comp15030_c0_seq2:2661-3920(+)